VFAAGSVTWTGSLSHNDYDNNVSRITRNALVRFLATPPGRTVLDDRTADPAITRAGGPATRA
jgi:N,N-dimethylformamidase